MIERRRFVDSDGYSWQVYEIDRADAAPITDDAGRTLKSGSLYFFSRDTTRVLSPYPSDWVEASWRELDHLCRMASFPHPRRQLERRPSRERSIAVP
jgi:hypothetical protein